MRPIIASAIELAISSKLFLNVIVLTDDADIVNVAKKHCADVPFIRSNALFSDYTSIYPVVLHAINYQ